jgi:hypothetical protein
MPDLAFVCCNDTTIDNRNFFVDSTTILVTGLLLI